MDILLISENRFLDDILLAELMMKTERVAVIKQNILNNLDIFHQNNNKNLSNQFSHIVIEANFFEETVLKKMLEIISLSECKVIIITTKTYIKKFFDKGKFVATKEECLKLI